MSALASQNMPAAAAPQSAGPRADGVTACRQRRLYGGSAAAGARPRATTARSAAADGSHSTPLLDAVAERGNRGTDVPFHVPGHKRGGTTPPALRQLLGGALRYDLTEIEGLDILSSPSGVIQQAQQLAAQAWGAEASWLLVNGTTCGIHAAVMSTCGPGDALIVARNAHLSAFNAMVLAGCTPVYVQPCYDPQLGIAHHIAPEGLQAAFREAEQRGLRVGAALVVSPTYFGVLSNITALADICHSHRVPLLVDEAHGAHLGLHPNLPPSALQCGADVAVQSTHKQLSAMTQAAMLHVQGQLVRRERVSRALQVLQSSSPSYLLMASLDAARAQASDPQAHAGSLAAASYARQQLASVPGVQLLSVAQAAACSASSSSSDSSSSGSDSSSSGSSGLALDPLRLTISLQQLGLTGYEAAAALEQHYSIVPELATPTCVVLALSIGSTLQHAQALVAALQQLSRRAGAQAQASMLSGAPSSPASLAPAAAAAASAAQVSLTPRDAFYAAAEAVPAAQAVGRVSAELLCPYPPGVPAAYPGEVITPEVLQQLRAVLAQGGTVTGCSDSSLRTLRVVVATTAPNA